jgi:hypothetical protein
MRERKMKPQAKEVMTIQLHYGNSCEPTTDLKNTRNENVAMQKGDVDTKVIRRPLSTKKKMWVIFVMFCGVAMYLFNMSSTYAAQSCVQGFCADINIINPLHISVGRDRAHQYVDDHP